MRLNLKQVSVVAGVGLLFAAFQNCSKSAFTLDQSSYDALNADYGGPAVCDPLGGGGGGGQGRQGLIGNLLYVPASKNPTAEMINDFASFVDHAVRAPVTVYMAQMNVPTRDWTEGFTTEDGVRLTDPTSGQPLLEFFGLNMQSVLNLTAADQDGYYQFATISDDGAILTSGDRVLAGDTGPIHGTTTDCGQTPVLLRRGQGLPINYFYFQSPRTAIASVIVWRRLYTNAIPDSTGCGLADAFKSTSGGNWSDMQQVGWRVIPSANFTLPADAPSNQCR